MKSTPETRAMAEAVLEYLSKYPEKHNQVHWNFNADNTGCGTTMCIGGTAAWLAYGRSSINMNIELEARNLLGLSEAEAEVLFFELDEGRALDKLKKVAIGEEFTSSDFYTLDEPDEEITFNSYWWEEHQKS